MNQETLRARLSDLNVEPPSPEAEDRAIRAGLEAFRRHGPRRSTGRPLAWRPLAWRPLAWRYGLGSLGARLTPRRMAFGAAAASLCIAALGTALLLRLDGAAPERASNADRGPVAILDPDPTERTPIQVAVTAERLEEVLQAYDSALREAVGPRDGAPLSAGLTHPRKLPAETADAGRADRKAIRVAITPERVEEILRVYDRAMRRKYGDELVERIRQMVQSGELREFLRKRQEQAGGNSKR